LLEEALADRAADGAREELTLEAAQHAHRRYNWRQYDAALTGGPKTTVGSFFLRRDHSGAPGAPAFAFVYDYF
jgi:hypothetical protein